MSVDLEDLAAGGTRSGEEMTARVAAAALQGEDRFRAIFEGAGVGLALGTADGDIKFQEELERSDPITLMVEALSDIAEGLQR